MYIKNSEIPLTLPVTAQDRFEYPLKYVIHALISFDQSLDADILKRAVRLSLDLEPVLGCTFVENDPQPYWRRFDDLDEMQWFTCINTDDKQEPIDRFVKGPFYHEGQQINVALFHAPDGDSLCIKICHACSDAGGLKSYLELLARLYTEMQENPDYQPEPLTHRRRDQQLYFDALGIADPLALFDPQVQEIPPEWAFPHHALERKEIHMAVRRFENESFDNIVAYAKQHNVTVTAVLLTAMFRSLFEMVAPPPGKNMGITVSVDLRHAIPDRSQQGVSNLPVGILPRIGRLARESFTETLGRAAWALEHQKKNGSETVVAIGMEVWGKVEYSIFLSQIQDILRSAAETGKSNPLLSNAGIIPPLRFGQHIAADVYLIAPAVIPPGFMLGVTTYGSAMTLQCSFGEPAHRQEDIEKFMDLMERELLSL